MTRRHGSTISYHGRRPWTGARQVTPTAVANAGRVAVAAGGAACAQPGQWPAVPQQPRGLRPEVTSRRTRRCRHELPTDAMVPGWTIPGDCAMGYIELTSGAADPPWAE